MIPFNLFIFQIIIGADLSVSVSCFQCSVLIIEKVSQAKNVSDELWRFHCLNWMSNKKNLLVLAILVSTLQICVSLGVFSPSFVYSQ